MRRPKARSQLETTFLLACREAGLPEPMPEYIFQRDRRWRADFAWPEQLLIVEIEGGDWIRGRHTRAAGYATDCIKYNSAQLAGWRVIRFSGELVRNALRYCVSVVRLCLER